MESLKERYQNLYPFGVVSITDTTSLLVYDPVDEDAYDCDFVTAYNILGAGLKGFSKDEVIYEDVDRAYIQKGKEKYYLDEIVKVGGLFS